MPARHPASACSLASALLLVIALAESSRADATPGDEFFESKVRPLLATRCLACHGNEGKVKGGLRLDSREAILRGGDSGPAAIPGKPDESAIVLATRYFDEPRMPPTAKLPEPEVETLARWVALGLPWPSSTTPAAGTGSSPTRVAARPSDWWAFRPIRDPEPPSVGDEAWSRTSLDRFVLAGLERAKIRPAPESDRRTLIRRVTFDLTGLPPSPEEVEAFVGDDRPDAYERVVDRLLASPRYGEHWGRHWLDLVRYADSRDARGIGGDADIGEAWRYRDWVIAAFNRDRPYDRFVVDQIAGDLLPADDGSRFNPEGMVATGLLTIGEWGPGDADKDKMMSDLVADQVDVVGRAFLGLTVACARCHDHKFDPISQADYYGMAGIFFSTHILPGPGPKTAGSPMLRTPLISPEALAANRRRSEDLAKLERDLASARLDESRAEARRSLSKLADQLSASARAIGRGGSSAVVDEAARSRGVDPRVVRRWIDALGVDREGIPLDQVRRGVLGADGFDSFAGPEDTPWIGVNRTDRPIAQVTYVLPPKSVDLHPGPREAAVVSWSSPIGGRVVVRGTIADADGGGGDGVAWTVERRVSRSWRAIGSGEIGNGGKGTIGPIAIGVGEGDRLRLVVSPKGSHTYDTTTVGLTIAPEQGGTPLWDLAEGLVPDLLLGGKGNPHPDRSGRAGTWRLERLAVDAARLPTAILGRPEVVSLLDAIDRDEPAAIEAAVSALDAAVKGPGGEALADAIASPGGPLDPGPVSLSAGANARLQSIEAEIARLKAEAPPEVPVGLVAQEGGVPGSMYEGFHDAKIQIRGEYSRLGAVVPRHFPEVIAGPGPATIAGGSGRLELARWITRPDHPLTARVMANRVWAFHLGEGIARSPSNFGKLGEPPDDPELLDHLASRLVASGWSIKALHRLILTSATYRQSATAPPESLRADPENRRFGRMTRRRLESEAIRDALLVSAGTLDVAMGGPSFPEFDRPRRTVYFQSVRSDRSSFGPLFDAADPTGMVDRRASSTVAPQALFLLNNPSAIAAAKGFADRVRREAKTVEARIDRAYRIAYGRPPSPREVELGRRVVGDRDDPLDWTAYAHILLCGNEFLYVD